MKKVFCIASVFLAFAAKAQIIFKTIVQEYTVEVGKSFPVGYILEATDEKDNFTQPFFNGLSLVSGPALYDGLINSPNGEKRVKNYVFTLLATRPGRYMIPGATARIHGRFIKSDDVFIEAVEKTGKTEDDSEYFLKPGEDPYDKIRRNLFMKVTVNRHICFTGEPVVATFKLYSRLQSKSDIVKNPGFYGFSVQDIVNLDDNVVHTETVDGKLFDVHTIRTVQLYPFQAGTFMIDPMEVMNTVEFSKSMVNKKTEQEVIEGVFETKKDPVHDNNTVTYENRISTDKISIHVKPLPEKNKPAKFNGAAGSFSISQTLVKNTIRENETSDLIIAIEGKGNFTQMPAPTIKWPAGIEGFDASVKDLLDKTQVPLKGTRIFRFPFIAGKSGTYILPAVTLAFFDTDSNKYKTVSSKPVEIEITKPDRPEQVSSNVQTKKNRNTSVLWWMLGLGMIVLVSVAFLYRKKARSANHFQPSAEKTEHAEIEEVLNPAYTALEQNDRLFYTILQQTVWDHLGKTLNLSGSKMSKSDLLSALHSKGVSLDQSKKLLIILQECETAAYTKAEFIHDRQELLTRTKAVLEEMKV